MAKQFQSCFPDGWQQPVTKEYADYVKTSVTRKFGVSWLKSVPSERIASAAEQLHRLASAQTTAFTEPNGLTMCRSNSRDSGLGRDSDSGSSSCSANVQMSTRTLASDCLYVDSRGPRHLSSQSSSQPQNQPVCTVMPMRNASQDTARSRSAATRYPHSQQQEMQQDTFHYFNSCEAFSGENPQLARQLSHRPVSCMDSKQHCYRQRCPVPQNVAYYGNTVNAVHYNGSRMPTAQELSQCRGDMTTPSLSYSTAGTSGFSRGRLKDCMSPTDPTFTQKHRMVGPDTQMPMFNCSSRQRAFIQQMSAHQRDELLCPDRSNMNTPYWPVVNPHCDSTSVTCYRAVPRRYRPYSISTDVQRGNGTVPCGGSQHVFVSDDSA